MRGSSILAFKERRIPKLLPGFVLTIACGVAFSLIVGPAAVAPSAANWHVHRLAQFEVKLEKPVRPPDSPQTSPATVGAETQLSPGCEAAQKRAQTVLSTLASKASPDVITFASSFTSKATSKTGAPAWNDFAGIAYLMGHADTALWAEVHALALAWRAEYVANGGVYLAKLGNFEDSKLFLHCAHDMGYRSPYLFEALAMAYHGLGQKAEAQNYIHMAQQLAPDDRLIQAEASFLISGKTPPKPGQKREDGLDRAVRELEAHLQEVSQRARQRLALAERVDPLLGTDDAKKVRRDLEKFERESELKLDDIRNVKLPLAKMSPSQFQARMGSRPLRVASQEVQGFRNLVIFMSVTEYFHISWFEAHLAVSSETGPGGWNLDFWAEAFYKDPLEYAREIAALKPYHGFPYYPDASAAARYIDVRREADPERDREGNQCRDNGCRRRVQAGWCARVIPAFESWQGEGKEQFVIGAARFNPLAQKRLTWGAARVMDARGYAVRTLEGFHKTRYTPTGDTGWDLRIEGLARADEGYLKHLNESYAFLVVTYLGDPQKQKSESLALLPWHLRETAREFEKARKYQEDGYKLEAARLTSDCNPVQKEILALLDDSGTKATRGELFDRLVASLNAKAELKPKCEFKLGEIASVSVSLDLEKLTPEYETKAEWKLRSGELEKLTQEQLEEGGKPGKWSLSAKEGEQFDANGNLTKASVSVSGSVSVSSGIVREKAEITLTAEWNAKTKKWKRLATVKGTAGLGYKAGAAEVGCYPGDLSMKFDPRDVMEKAIAYLEST